MPQTLDGLERAVVQHALFADMEDEVISTREAKAEEKRCYPSVLLL